MVAQTLPEPVVIGRATERFTVGALLYEDPLDHPDTFSKNWLVQMNDRGTFERYAEIRNGQLEVLDPSGCTIWFREQLRGPLCITYTVVVPSDRDTGTIIMPRDINNFWMAGEIGHLDRILTGPEYGGNFPAYHSMQGYYASMGGGSVTDNNRTVRMRIYPRVRAGEQVEHLALKSQDDQLAWKIRPGKLYTIQLVCFEDLIQFIINGQLVYEAAFGDRFTATVDNQHFYPVVYTPERNPVYTEGYFGFRMTHSFHRYSNFRVYRLLPIP